MATNEIKMYFGRCRCCLSYGYLKNMWEEHEWEGEKEIYVHMLVQCFALSWEHSEESIENDQICESCIKRLRDAYDFKKVILESQEELLKQSADVQVEVERVKTDTAGTVEVRTENPATVIKIENEEEQEIGTGSEDAGDNMYIDDPDDPEYVDPDDPQYVDPDDPGVPDTTDPNVEYQEVEYLEDEDGLAAQSNSETVRRRKRQAEREPGQKWPKKLPKQLRQKTYKQYSEEDLRRCLEVVRNGELTSSEASIKYKIPQKTIDAKLKVGPTDDQIGIVEDTTEEFEESFKTTRVRSDKNVIYKFKENVRKILENSNATPIRGYWGLGYGCCYCQYQNPLPSELKKHTLETHFDIIEELQVKSYVDSIVKLDITGLQCKICRENFSLLNDFKKHLLYHDIKIYFDIDDYIIPFKFDNDNLSCCLCVRQFDYFKHLSEHMNDHYRHFECHICGRGFIKRRSLRTHLIRHKTGVYICSYCSKIFDNRIKLREHERVLHIQASKTRKCAYCDEKFMDAVRKTQHEVSVHGIEQPTFECKACGKIYESKRALKSHTNQYHLMLKLHNCEICGQGFYYGNELKRHMVKHTRIKEIQCKICSKWYSTKKSLRVHLKLHNNDKQFACEKCGQAFVQKINWLHHLRTKHGESV